MKQSAVPTCVSRPSILRLCSVTMSPPDEKEGDQPGQAALLPRRLGLQLLLWRDFYRDQMGLGRLRLRQRDRQHAEVVGRLDLVGIDRGRQPEGPLEGAIGPLIARDLLGLLLRHLLLRALDRQQVALHRDLHVLGLHPRHLRHEVDDIGLLEDVHQRLPSGGRSLGYGPLKRRAERVVEDPAHPVLQVMQQLQHRVPLCNTEHIVAPSWLLACREPISVNYQALNCHKMLQCTSLVKYTTRCVIVLYNSSEVLSLRNEEPPLSVGVTRFATMSTLGSGSPKRRSWVRIAPDACESDSRRVSRPTQPLHGR